MRYNHIKSILLILIVTVSQTTKLFGQVTIGSDIAPNAGSLLDLKEFPSDPQKQGATSNKGLILPRVRLTVDNSLTDILINPISNEEKKNHTGLLVYNINKCFYNGTGIYVWSGNKWSAISGNVNVKELDLPNSYIISASPQIFKFPAKKAFSAWNFYASNGGDNLLSSASFKDSITVIVYKQTGNIIDGSPTINRQDRCGQISVNLNGNTGNAILSLKEGDIIRWSWYIQVVNSQK